MSSSIGLIVYLPPHSLIPRKSPTSLILRELGFQVSIPISKLMALIVISHRMFRLVLDTCNFGGTERLSILNFDKKEREIGVFESPNPVVDPTG